MPSFDLMQVAQSAALPEPDFSYGLVTNAYLRVLGPPENLEHSPVQHEPQKPYQRYFAKMLKPKCRSQNA